MDDEKASTGESPPVEDRPQDTFEPDRYQATKNCRLVDVGTTVDEENKAYEVKTGDVVKVVDGLIELPTGERVHSLGFFGAVSEGWFVPYKLTMVCAIRRSIESENV